MEAWELWYGISAKVFLSCPPVLSIVQMMSGVSQESWCDFQHSHFTKFLWMGRPVLLMPFSIHRKGCCDHDRWWVGLCGTALVSIQLDWTTISFIIHTVEFDNTSIIFVWQLQNHEIGQCSAKATVAMQNVMVVPLQPSPLPCYILARYGSRSPIFTFWLVLVERADAYESPI